MHCPTGWGAKDGVRSASWWIIKVYLINLLLSRAWPTNLCKCPTLPVSSFVNSLLTNSLNRATKYHPGRVIKLLAGGSKERSEIARCAHMLALVANKQGFLSNWEKCWYLWEKNKASSLFFLMICSAIKRHRATSTAGTNLSKSTDWQHYMNLKQLRFWFQSLNSYK